MKVLKIVTIGASLLLVAAFVDLCIRSNKVSTSNQNSDSIIILKDSLSKFQDVNSTLKHEKLEMSRQLALANNRNASLLAVMESINKQLSRQYQDSNRVREQRTQTKR